MGTAIRPPSNGGALLSVSVIVPVYNGGEVLKKCLASLTRQTYNDPWEILVVDDGSTDDTAEIAQRFERVRLIATRHAGVSAARNRGLEDAKGGIICFTDADCLPAPDWIEAFVNRFQQDNNGTVGALHGAIVPPSPSTLFVRCDYLMVAHGYRPWQPERERLTGDTGNMAVRSIVVERVGGFDETIAQTEDADFCLRIVRAGFKNVYTPTALVIHDHQRTSLWSFLRKWHRLGRGRMQVWTKHPGELPYSRWFPRSAFLLYLLAPLYALSMTGFTLWMNPRDRALVLLLSPLIYLGRLAESLGFAQAARSSAGE